MHMMVVVRRSAAKTLRGVIGGGVEKYLRNKDPHLSISARPPHPMPVVPVHS